MAASVDRAPVFSLSLSHINKEIAAPAAIFQGVGICNTRISIPVAAPTKLALIRVSASSRASVSFGR